MAGKKLQALETNILQAKGMTAKQIDKLAKAGVKSRADFATIADAATLAELTGVKNEIAERVMSWALGPKVALSADAVLCAHCNARQPRDYKSGDLCPSCGRQAEPTQACFWCNTSGPGHFCRSCGAKFVAPAELQLAQQLKRDGLPKDEIPARIEKLSASEREVLWGRVRKAGRAG